MYANIRNYIWVVLWIVGWLNSWGWSRHTEDLLCYLLYSALTPPLHCSDHARSLHVCRVQTISQHHLVLHPAQLGCLVLQGGFVHQPMVPIFVYLLSSMIHAHAFKLPEQQTCLNNYLFGTAVPQTPLSTLKPFARTPAGNSWPPWWPQGTSEF